MIGTNDDPLLSSLLSAAQDDGDHALAARYVPLIRFDAREPFYPLAAGYTLFRENGASPSYTKGREIELAPEGEPPASLAIEYAVWWDWDIGHLYELEHLWVYVDRGGRVVRGEASWHGDYHDMRHQGNLALVDDRLVVYSEPGKHAFAPTPEWFRKRREERVRSETSALAGCGGVLVARYFEGMIPKGPLQDLLVRSYLSERAFEPSLDFSRTFEFSPDMLVPWPALLEWIPTRVNAWLDRLRAEIPPSGYRFWRIGHRGARAHAPDNTLSSFRKAAELGADLVELDVQCTADGHVVVLHDTHLVDPEGKIWPVQGSTLAELQAIDVGGGEHVPTLGEALEVCRAENIGAYVELKDGDAVFAVAASLREWKLGPYSIVGSFRPDWLAALKALDPTVRTSVLFSSPEVDAVKLAQSVGASYVHPCWERFPHPSSLLTAEWVGRVREAGLGIICWHEERPEEIAALRQVGVDGICSDAPELLLGAAGQVS